jgi:hypothetical protein
MYANRMVAETVPNLKLNRIRLVYVIWKKWFDSTNYFLFILKNFKNFAPKYKLK